MKYEDKNQDYYSNIRLDLLSLFPKHGYGIKVLEVGAGNGATLTYLKSKGMASEIVGIDIPESKRGVTNDLIDDFIYGNIEELDLESYKNYFDCIILADVLEHLVHPDKVLIKIKKLLKKEGVILVSMPNVRHYKTFLKIFIKGDFSYEESGLFDYTHLRFFCKKNIEDLIISNGFQLEKTLSSIKIYDGKSGAKTLNKITFGLFEEFLSVQYFVRARSKS